MEIRFKNIFVSSVGIEVGTEVLFDVGGLPVVGGVVDVGTGLELAAHALLGILVVGDHVVLPVEELGEAEAEGATTHLAATAEGDGEVEAGIVLAAGEDAEDTHGIVAEMAGEVEADAVVAVEEAAASEAGLYLRGGVVVADTAEDTQAVGTVDMVAAVLSIGVAEERGLQTEGQRLAGTVVDQQIAAELAAEEEAAREGGLQTVGEAELLAQGGNADMDEAVGLLLPDVREHGEHGLQRQEAAAPEGHLDGGGEADDILAEDVEAVVVDADHRVDGEVDTAGGAVGGRGVT